MSSAPRYIPHYTVKDYELWEGDWELWQGIAVAMTPSPFGRHQEIAVKLAAELLRAVEDSGCDATVLSEIDWIISDDTVVRPDLLAVCGGPPEKHVMSPPAIVVEILSPSTASRDRGEKLHLYDDHGVQYYIIVDPADNSFELFAREVDHLVSSTRSSSSRLTIGAGCELSIAMGRKFV